MTAPGLHDALKQQFGAFRQALTAARAQYPQAEGWVRSAELVKLLGTVCNRVSIEARDPLTDDDYRTILLSRFRYAATAADGRFSSVIDQAPLAAAFARTVLSTQKQPRRNEIPRDYQRPGAACLRESAPTRSRIGLEGNWANVTGRGTSMAISAYFDD